MSESVLDQLKKLIAEELDVNLSEKEIDENVSLFEGGLGFDSVVIVELIALVEEHFGFQFSDDELKPESFSTLGVLEKSISDKIK